MLIRLSWLRVRFDVADVKSVNTRVKLLSTMDGLGDFRLPDCVVVRGQSVTAVFLEIICPRVCIGRKELMWHPKAGTPAMRRRQ